MSACPVLGENTALRTRAATGRRLARTTPPVNLLQQKLRGVCLLPHPFRHYRHLSSSLDDTIRLRTSTPGGSSAIGSSQLKKSEWQRFTHVDGDRGNRTACASPAGQPRRRALARSGPRVRLSASDVEMDQPVQLRRGSRRPRPYVSLFLIGLCGTVSTRLVHCPILHTGKQGLPGVLCRLCRPDRGQGTQ